jgi:hypothetical protein
MELRPRQTLRGKHCTANFVQPTRSAAPGCPSGRLSYLPWLSMKLEGGVSGHVFRLSR